MKYSEFREYSNRNDIPLREDEERLIVNNQFEISKNEECSIRFSLDFIDYPYQCEMLKRIIELAETPLDERGGQKRHYLKHRYINNGGDNEYLNYVQGNYVEGNYIILADKCQSPNYKTKFTKAEIEELKVEFDTDFNDFELLPEDYEIMEDQNEI